MTLFVNCSWIDTRWQ